MNYQGDQPRIAFTCRLTEETYDFLCMLAIRKDMSLSLFIENLLDGIKSKRLSSQHDRNGSCQMSQQPQ